MMTETKTPISTMRGYELTGRLQSILKQAYHRRSRKMPDDLDTITDTLKKDLLRNFPDCPIEVVDDGIVSETLNNPDAVLSEAFFYNAVKKAWFVPKTNFHQWDGEEYCRPSMETDTLNHLDTCALMIKEQDHAVEHKYDSNDIKPIGCSLKKIMPAFNPRYEYAYLVMRGQLDANAWPSYIEKAIEDVNRQRLAANHNRVIRAEAEKDPDVMAMCKRLAVLDWLRSCNVTGITPSAILKPLINENEYQIFRRENA